MTLLLPSRQRRIASGRSRGARSQPPTPPPSWGRLAHPPRAIAGGRPRRRASASQGCAPIASKIGWWRAERPTAPRPCECSARSECLRPCRCDMRYSHTRQAGSCAILADARPVRNAHTLDVRTYAEIVAAIGAHPDKTGLAQAAGINRNYLYKVGKARELSYDEGYRLARVLWPDADRPLPTAAELAELLRELLPPILAAGGDIWTLAAQRLLAEFQPGAPEEPQLETDRLNALEALPRARASKSRPNA